MSLNFPSLEKATQNFERAITRAKRNESDSELRDAVIQRFEYTYELCWKMLKRQMELEASSPTNIDQLSFRDLIREAAEKGFINDPPAWFIYREVRRVYWSGRPDLNRRPLAPQASALPGCATPRYL
jgi:nucleotidyltransferase substrate binding protein (TIGR01987 family)